jgi:hypothetical protein
MMRGVYDIAEVLFKRSVGCFSFVIVMREVYCRNNEFDFGFEFEGYRAPVFIVGSGLINVIC